MTKIIKLEVKRAYKGSKYTIGKLFIDGAYFCDTLEPVDRGLHATNTPLDEVLAVKKLHPAKVAIPYGCYQVGTSEYSPRFSKVAWYVQNMDGGRVPRIHDVLGFEGVLFHAGNTASDTEGCILLGVNKAVGQVLDSKAWCKRFFDRINGQPVILHVTP